MARKKKQPAAAPDADLRITPAMLGPDPTAVAKIQKGFKSLPQVVVNDADSSRFAQELVTGWKAEQKRLLDQRMDITRGLDATKRKIMALFEPSQDLLDQMIGQLSGRIVTYETAVRRAAAEAQRKLDEEIEAKRQADLKLAEKARKRGDEDKATEFEVRAETRVAPLAPVHSSVGGGRALVDVWTWELLDESKLVREYLEAAKAKITATVKAMHKDAEGIVGKGAIRVTSSGSLRG